MPPYALSTLNELVAHTSHAEATHTGVPTEATHTRRMTVYPYVCRCVISQYEVQLQGYGPDGLVYAPRDEDRYIRRAANTPEMSIRDGRRLSQQRRLIRKLEDSLCSCKLEGSCKLEADTTKIVTKQLLYDKLRTQHKLAIDRIIADIWSWGGPW